MIVNIIEKSDAGQKNNEDAYFTKIMGNRIFTVIADGVTTLDAGEKAANFVIESFKNWIKKRYDPNFSKATLIRELNELVLQIHENLKAIGDDENLKLGSTLSLAIITKTRLLFVHVGDSRIYIKQDDNLRKITIDQTVENYEKLTGQVITSVEKDKKEHTLMQCVGRGEIKPYIGDMEIDEKVDVLLCSDGLTNNISEKRLYEELDKKIAGEEMLNNLIKLARDKGETDNITGVLIRREKKK